MYVHQQSTTQKLFTTSQHLFTVHRGGGDDIISVENHWSIFYSMICSLKLSWLFYNLNLQTFSTNSWTSIFTECLFILIPRSQLKIILNVRCSSSASLYYSHNDYYLKKQTNIVRRTTRVIGNAKISLKFDEILPCFVTDFGLSYIHFFICSSQFFSHVLK